MSRHDAFLSYASEDLVTAQQLHDGLTARGFKIWFAPEQLNIGDRLQGSLEEAMARCFYGIFLVSPDHLRKVWTSHEMETYRRAAIEGRKHVLPVLCGITKDQLEESQPSLANLITSDVSKGISQVVKELSKVLGRGAPTIGAVPPWMDPVHRFLQGYGEIFLHERDVGGFPKTATIWELLAFPQEGEYPLFLDGQLYSHRHLLWCAAAALFHNPALARKVLQKADISRINSMIRHEFPKYAQDPELIANMPYPGDKNSSRL